MQNRRQSNNADASQTVIPGKRKREWRKNHVESEIETAASSPTDAPVLLFAGISNAQYPLLDKAANKVIQKYQNSSCEQLWQERGQLKTQREQEAVNFLRNDPQMRRMFIDRVAAPIANKMFECGMIP